MFLFLKSRLIPFKYPTYRKYFLVQTLSQTGTWSHELARAWLVLEILGNATGLGILSLAAALPVLLLILQGGVTADKKNVKNILLITRIALGFAAFAFAYMTEYTQIQYWHVVMFAVIEGLCASYDMPAMQSLAARLVPRHHFQQALALNSSNFHLSRALGPLVAGLLMAFHGPSLVFLLDGLSYFIMLAIIRSLNLEPSQAVQMAKKQNNLQALVEGIHYLMKFMRYRVLQLMLTVTLLMPAMAVIFRAYLKHKFNLDSESFGYVFSSPAIGAFVAAMFFVMAKFKDPILNLAYALPLLCLSLLSITFINNIYLLPVALFFNGFFSYLNFASLTHSLHLAVTDDYRGRLGSVIGLGFLSIGPLMGYPVGFFADSVGYENAIYIIVGSFALLSCIFAIKWAWKSSDTLHPQDSAL